MKPVLRILIVDDNEQIHKDFTQTLCPSSTPEEQALEIMESELFDLEEKTKENGNEFELIHAYQGDEAISIMDRAAEKGESIHLIFMDVRMPPGLNGIEASKRIWSTHKNVEIVICTAYADMDWDDIGHELKHTDHLLFLKKPYEPIEVRQIARSLLQKAIFAEERRQYSSKLEHEVNLRTQELKTEIEISRFKEEELFLAKEELEFASKVKDAFTSHLSKDLQKPLEKAWALAQNIPASEDAVVLQETLQEMKNLTSKILDLSVAESRNKSVSHIRFNPESMVYGLMDMFRARLLEKGLELFIDIDALPKQIIGDPTRLRQVLLNILDNSIRYSEKGEVHLCLRVEDTSDTHCTIDFTVKDSGIGMTTEEVASLKNLFQSTHDDQYLGPLHHGLGLTVASRLIHTMGGVLRLQSEESEGSIFHFQLTFERSQEIASVEVPFKVIDASVLLCSSCESMEKSINELLCQESNVATNMKEYLEIHRTFSSDITIFDLKDGEFLLDELKALPKNILKQSLILTLDDQQETLEKIRNLGCKSYLMKPLRKSELIKRVVQLLPDRVDD